MRPALLLAALLAASSAYADPDPPRFEVPAAGAPTLGADEAPVTIAIFSDFLCRYCGRASRTLADLRLLYGDALRLVYHQALLDPEDGAAPAELALAAAAQGRFWPLHDRLFAAERALDRAGLEAMAASVGVDIARVRRELAAGTHRPALDADLLIGERLGVVSTPMFFVNGRPLAGNQPIGEFTRVIDDELARVAALHRAGLTAAAIRARLMRGAPSIRQPTPDRTPVVRAPELDTVHQVGLGTLAQRHGPEQAPVTIIEFADSRCGYCARVGATLAELDAARPGQLRFVVRFAPLGGDAISELAAEAALAAGDQGRFLEFFTRALAVRELDRAALDAIADQLGLDLVRFDAALADRRHRRTVLADAAEASRLGVRGTPTFFIAGRALVGAQPLAAFEALVDEALAARGRP